ncbi:hypothetical protein ACHAXR_003790, partial [Thalassiosira sp. AJA248-18]
MPPTKRRRSASPLPSSANKKTNTSSRPRPSTNSPNKSQNNRGMKQWKDDYNTHQFLDASATVHAGLFGSRRLPEIKSLWRQMVQEEFSSLPGGKSDGSNVQVHGSIRRAGESGGGKISSRHLRRRTNSHKRRRRHRFPRGICDSGGGGTGVREDAEDANDVTNDNAKNDEPDVGDDSEKKSSAVQKHQKQKCRRARRKPALMKKSHSHWWEPQTHSQVDQTQSLIQSNELKSPHKWVSTHLWHAKRFHVSPPLFSWSIPLLHSNRGSRASLRLASSEESPKCTIQDGTWEINGCAIMLEVNKVEASPQSPQQPMQTLISILHRLCGSEATFLNEESIVMGQKSGEGLIHEIDACPLQPIGPATFFFGCSNLESGSENAHVSIFIHPTIHQRVVSLLTTILPAGVETSNEVTLSTVPLALLKIRGRASTPTLCGLLKNSEKIGALKDDDDNHGTLIEIGSLPFLTVAQNKDSKPPRNTITNQSSILLKSHRPNQNYQHLPHNLAISGWDIICHPSISSSLFLSLVNSGGACPIGLVEDTRAHLEAYPPLSVFPRDYPDTEVGKAYWEGGTSAASMKENEAKSVNQWKDWAVIRACVEGSWGRIDTTLKRTIRHWNQSADLEKRKTKEASSKLHDESPAPELVTKGQILGRDATSIHWPSLIAPAAESTIVVRGSFGIPFLQLLHGCGRLCHSQPRSNSAESTRHRRPRRKVCPPTSIVAASPLSKNDSEVHSNMCQQLMASLSLPATLRCELY